MAKIILLAIIVYVVYRFARQGAPKNTVRKSEEYMVQCAHCGVFQLKSESIASGGLFFCCEEHRRIHER